uniref:MARVEL domain-containing protein n=1 Tax=Pygocentrus nattereri TaxID=42514 RepID=A0A3B4DF96_PYGNA
KRGGRETKLSSCHRGNGKDETQKSNFKTSRLCSSSAVCVPLLVLNLYYLVLKSPPLFSSSTTSCGCAFFPPSFSPCVANSLHPKQERERSTPQQGDAPQARDKQDLVPIVGGERWLLTNMIHDIAATLLYLSVIGIMIYKTNKNSFCNLKHYKEMCLYTVYLIGSVFACLTACVYLLSAIYGSCRKCQGQQTVV